MTKGLLLARLEGRARARKRAGTKLGRRDSRFGLSLIAPTVVLVGLVTLFPMIRAFLLSVHATTFLTQGRFVGLEQYKQFLDEPFGVSSLISTAVFTVGSVLLIFPFATLLAILLNQPFRGRTLVRTLLILPWIVSPILSALMWGWTVEATIGPIPYLLNAWFGVNLDVFANGGTAMITLIVVNVWRTFPFAMVLILAALQTIPVEIYEAAELDGAGEFRRLISVTIPMISGTLLIALIMVTINCVNMVDLPLILTGGGPVHATDILGLKVYREAFFLNRFGYASAIAMIMLAINAVISIAYIRVLRRED